MGVISKPGLETRKPNDISMISLHSIVSQVCSVKLKLTRYTVRVEEYAVTGQLLVTSL
jgi:hypothetical protein